MNFDWNPDKAARNFEKHGITFEEAKTVFDDPLFVEFFDPDHSEAEQRFLIIGASHQNRLLIVSYTERDSRTRLISARELTAQERRIYEQG